MRNILYLLPFLLLCSSIEAQNTTNPKKEKDSIKTEVINVVTSYTPTISDAFKIKKNPTIQLGSKTKKRALKYQIFSAPVASTFIPKTGIVKGISMGVKERTFSNYVAAGFGNNSTPFVEAFIHHSTRFKNSFGMYANYISSENGVIRTPLKNDFSKLTLGAFYKQEERSFNWQAGADYKRNSYNWYGLPTNVSFSETTINAIKEDQLYTSFDTYGEVDFDDLFITDGKVQLSFFSDNINSKELRFSIDPTFKVSLQGLGRNFNDLTIEGSLDYLNGEFSQSYNATTIQEHSFFTLGAAPKYSFSANNFSILLGAKIYINADLENKINQFYIYPDIQIGYPLIEKYARLYLGVNGDLKTNSYREFVSNNPYVSPTLYITQTNKKYKFFGGVNGKLSSNVSYEIKASYSQEEDKALFIRNNSKSDGTNFSGMLGYEYGNSFSVVYDDVKTLTIFTEITMDVSSNLVIGANAQFNTFTPTSQIEVWNSPTMEAELFGKLKVDKWYAGANIFIIGERKDLLYNATYPSSPSGVHNLKSYVDFNLNGGYHINDKFTAFLKLNNILNKDYDRFANFTVQGFQVLGGVSYKFDF